MIVLAEPDPVDMVLAIRKAISILPKIDPQVMHERVSNFYVEEFINFENLTYCVMTKGWFDFFQMKKLYHWHDVAKRTEIVYDRALKCSNQNLLERLSR